MARLRKDGVRTRCAIVQVATRLFLELGYNKASASMIADEVGITKANVAHHFPAKEDMLLELVKDMTDFQWKLITEHSGEMESVSPLFAYALEVAMQTAMCEDNPQAKDLYVTAYTSVSTLAYIKEWAHKKAYNLFSDRLPEWTIEDFCEIENFTTGVELGALMKPCTEDFPLDKKVAKTLDCLLKIYEVPKAERDATIEAVLASDYRANGTKALESFVVYINEANDRALEEAKSKL